MKMKYLMFMVAMFMVGHGAGAATEAVAPAAGAYPVDKEFRAQEEAVITAQADCKKKNKNIVLQFNCGSDARKSLFMERPARGVGYAIKFYGNLPNSEAFAKWKELRGLRDQARSEKIFTSSNKRPAGELTKEMLTEEMSFIETAMQQRGYVLMDANDIPDFKDLKRR